MAAGDNQSPAVFCVYRPMPFSGPNDPELPDNIQALPEEKRNQWVSAWNAAFDRCVNESGEDCEGVAFRIANSAIEEEEEAEAETSIPNVAGHSMVETISNTLYAELAALTDGKPFDGFTHSEDAKDGMFLDMRWQEIKVQKKELPVYLSNTLENIEATRTDSGVVLGLPIDSEDHDGGDAAGYIVGAELVGEVIRFIPRWTELGREKIKKGLRRMFSATFNHIQKVILGGSLTNWPASRNEKGQILLKPIELSQGFYVVEQAQSDTLEDVAEITTTAKGHAVTVMSDDGMLLPQNLKDLSTELQEKDEPQREAETQGVLSMEITEKKLQERIAAEVAKGISTAQKSVLGSDPDVVNSASEGKASEEVANILEALGQEDFEDKAKAEMVSFFLEKEAALREYASREAVIQLANIRRKSHIAEFAQKVTDGTDEYPRGLPVTTDRINKFLLSLAPDQATEAQEIFEAVQRTGLVEFKEKGHGRRLMGTVELETPVKKMLAKWIAGEGSISEFFEVNASELGDMEQYNLSEFKEKVKESTNG